MITWKCVCPRSLQYPIEFSNGSAWRVVDCQHLTTHFTKDYDINDQDMVSMIKVDIISMIKISWSIMETFKSSHRNEASFPLAAVGLEAVLSQPRVACGMACTEMIDDDTRCVRKRYEVLWIFVNSLLHVGARYIDIKFGFGITSHPSCVVPGDFLLEHIKGRKFAEALESESWWMI